jgi:outer membrane protein assembly factor BamB
VLWKIDVPWSPSSPCIWGDRIFLTTFAEGKLETRGYDRADGKLLWASGVTAEKLEEYHKVDGSPAAATPATDGNVVVSYFGSFGVVAYDLDGRELWRHRLPIATTGGDFGSGTSPIIADGRVLLARDMTENSTLLALDPKTGKTLWETARPVSWTSYTTPIVRREAGVAEIVMAGSMFMTGYDLATGAERWRVAGLPFLSCPTPVLGDGLIFFAGWSPGGSDAPWPTWERTLKRLDKNGDGKISREEWDQSPGMFKLQDVDGDGFITEADWKIVLSRLKQGENALLAVRPGGSGDVTATHVAWKFNRGLPYVPSPLFFDGRVYLIKDGGMMSSFDAKTGKPYYTQERVKEALGAYYASPVAADGRIYVVSLQGKLSVIKAGGDLPEVLHQSSFGERISATPALVGENLYLRTKTKLYGFGGEGR